MILGSELTTNFFKKIRGNEKRIWFQKSIAILMLFIIIALFFIFSIKDHTYLGIRVKRIENEWVIKKIQNGGAARQTSLKKGDVIIRINDKTPDENKTLTRWLVLEEATEIQVLRDEEKRDIIFPNERNMLSKQLLFTFIATICLSVLFFLPTLLSSSTTYRLFFMVVTSFSFSLISVIPSSIGNDFARIIIVFVLSFFPFACLKFYDYGKEYLMRMTKITQLIRIIGITNMVFLFLNFCDIGRSFAPEYLAIGIFYVCGLLLMMLAVLNLVYKRNTDENGTFSQVNLPLISIMSIIPLFFFYLFPTEGNAPFVLVVLFILLPLVAITHLLFINRLIKNSRKLDATQVLFFMLIGIVGIIWLLIELGHYIGTIYLTLFTVLLIYTLHPLLAESLSLIYRTKTGTNGTQIFISVEEERESISAHIHDTIIQEVIFEMNRLEQKEVIDINEINSVLDETIYSLRELCTHIYPLMIQEVGIEHTLNSTIKSIQQKYPVVIVMTFDSRVEKQPARIKNFLLRTTRETIINSIKHGKATEIDITIVIYKDNLVLKVIDNGRSDIEYGMKDNHFGMHLINEKAKMLEGSVSLTKQLKKTIFKLEFPITRDKKNEVEL